MDSGGGKLVAPHCYALHTQLNKVVLLLPAPLTATKHHTLQHATAAFTVPDQRVHAVQTAFNYKCTLLHAPTFNE
jgi:hypothetical protein